MARATSIAQRPLLGLLAAGLGASGASFLLPRSTETHAALFAAVAGIALLAAALGRRRAAGAERSAWLWTIVSLGGFLAAELIRFCFPHLRLGPFRSAADALILLSCVPLAATAACLLSAREHEHDRSAWLEAGILTAAAGVVAWAFVIEPQVRDRALTGSVRLLTIAHPLVDLLVLGFVLRLLISRQARDRSTLSFSLGAAILLLANLALSRPSVGTSAPVGSRFDPLVLLSFVLIGLAAPIQTLGHGARTHRSAALGRARFAIVLCAVFVPELILVRSLERSRLLGLNTLTVATSTSFVVIALAAVCLLLLLGRAREAEANRGEARLSALIRHSADAILMVDEEQRILFASPSAETLWGRKARALHGASILDSFLPEQREAVAEQLGNLVSMPPESALPLEGAVQVGGGQVRMLEGIARNLLEDENVRAIVVTVRDTTSRRALEQQLERRAFHDDLTGLANRALFADRLSHALKRSARTGPERIAVMFVDLDDFKAVNDGMGHGAGDELIRGVAERIRSSVRPGDTVARLGGDEFALLLEDVPSVSHATSLAGRLLEVLQLPIDVLGVGLAVPASVGVTFATNESTAESLLRDADIAMYSAKSLGKSRVAVFDKRLRDVAVRRLALKVELPRALSAEEFHVDYQPIWRIEDERLHGFEALVRWHHPQRGLVSPGEFIPAAEETGMIVDLGRWVLAKACEEAVYWNRNSSTPLTISVNVSGLQLHQPGFVGDVLKILETTGLAARLLSIELTESVLVKHQRVESILAELRAIGVGIAIDDFGTGYSSLSYLQQFPATSIKVDQRFVADLVGGGEVGLVRSILSIGAALGLTTVAEGVETAEQLAVLRGLGCDLAQGFLLGRPQSSGQIDGMLEVERMARTAQRRRAPLVGSGRAVVELPAQPTV